jgi:hypothetical protein
MASMSDENGDFSNAFSGHRTGDIPTGPELENTVAD